MRTLRSAGVLFLLVLLQAAPGRADLVFSISPTSSSVAPGGTINFLGTVINTGPGDLNLDSIASVFVPDLDRTEDFTPFFTNFYWGTVGPLGDGSAIIDSPIYDLLVNPTAAPGVYTGFLTIYDESSNELATQSFTVAVTPEPGEFVLYGVGIAGLLVWKRRRRVGEILTARTA